MNIQSVLSESDIINRIERGEVFSAQIDRYAFEIKVHRYVPCICTAIHHGHQICASLTDDLLVSEAERQFEEDPYTGDFIDALPISIKLRICIVATIESCIVWWGSLNKDSPELPCMIFTLIIIHVLTATHRSSILVRIL